MFWLKKLLSVFFLYAWNCKMTPWLIVSSFFFFIFYHDCFFRKMICPFRKKETRDWNQKRRERKKVSCCKLMFASSWLKSLSKLICSWCISYKLCTVYFQRISFEMNLMIVLSWFVFRFFADFFFFLQFARGLLPLSFFIVLWKWFIFLLPENIERE